MRCFPQGLVPVCGLAALPPQLLKDGLVVLKEWTHIVGPQGLDLERPYALVQLQHHLIHRGLHQPPRALFLRLLQLAALGQRGLEVAQQGLVHDLRAHRLAHPAAEEGVLLRRRLPALRTPTTRAAFIKSNNRHERLQWK